MERRQTWWQEHVERFTKLVPAPKKSIIVAALVLMLGVGCSDDPIVGPLRDANRPPLAAVDPSPMEVTQGDTISADLHGWFSDPDGDRLRYSVSWSNPRAISSWIRNNTLHVEGREAGFAQVLVRAMDPRAQSAQLEFPVEVLVANHPPRAVGTIEDHRLTQGARTVISFESLFTDADGDVLDFLATSSAPNIVQAQVRGELLILAAERIGESIIELRALDHRSESAVIGFRVVVDDGNRAPVATAELADQVIGHEDSTRVLLSTYFRDPNRDSLTYSATALDSAVVEARIARDTLHLIPASLGETTVQVRARDPKSASLVQAFRVVVVDLNLPPRITRELAAPEMQPGDSAVLVLPDHFRDPDGDTIRYSASSANPGIASVFVRGDALHLRAYAGGETVVRVRASSLDHDAVTDFTVRVGLPNGSPFTIGEFRPRRMMRGDTAALAMEPFFRDPDQDPLLYSVTASDTAVLRASFVADTLRLVALSDGSVDLTVSVEDPTGLRASRSASLTVGPANRPPVARQDEVFLTAVRADRWLEVELPLFVRDPDGDSLSYEVFTSDREAIRGTVDEEILYVTPWNVGDATLRLVATDPFGASAVVMFQAAAIAPPVVNFDLTRVHAKEGDRAIVTVHLAGIPDEGVMDAPMTDTMRLSFSIEPEAMEDLKIEEAEPGDWRLANPGHELMVSPRQIRDSIIIEIRDDTDIEHPQEALKVSLEAADSIPPYVLGPRTEMDLVIDEGVCDRSPPVNQALTAATDRRGESAGRCDLMTQLRLDDIEILVLFGRLPQPTYTGFRERDFIGLENVRLFVAGFIRFPDFPWESDIFEPMKSLGSINFASSNMTGDTIPAGAFRHLQDLWQIEFHGADSLRLHPDVFDDVPDLEHLSLSEVAWDPENPPITPDHLEPLGKLLRLDLPYIEELGDTRFLNESPFEHLRNLRILRLDDSHLDSLPAGIFKGLRSLTRLFLNGNNITELPVNELNLPELWDLNIAENQLESLPTGMFEAMPNLIQLNAGENRITSLPRRFFEGARRFEAMNLGGQLDDMGEEIEDDIPLTVTIERVDGKEAQSSGPADIMIKIREGAPINIPFTFIAAPERDLPPPATVYRGRVQSGPLRVETTSEAGLHLGIFQRAFQARAADFPGLSVRVRESLSLFTETEVSLPLPIRDVAPRYLAPHMETIPSVEIHLPDYMIPSNEEFGDLTYRATSDSDIVRLEVAGNSTDAATLKVYGLDEGEATVEVQALRPVPNSRDTAKLTQTFDVAFDTPPAGWENEFNIDLRVFGDTDESGRELLQAAVDKWHTVITGDVHDVRAPPPHEWSQWCWFQEEGHIGFFDDLTIFAAVEPFDGPLGTLGFANICGWRNEDEAPHEWLPVIGFFVLDADDVGTVLDTPRRVFDVVFHELAHVIGFNITTWENPFTLYDLQTGEMLAEQDSLIIDPAGFTVGVGNQPYFVGYNAYREYLELHPEENRSRVTAKGVPLQSFGAAGNINSHWQESDFANELMTPFYNPAVANPISRMTLALFDDLGYEVNYDAAEPYRLPDDLLAGARAEPDHLIDLTHDSGPPGRLVRLPDGRIVQVWDR